MKKNWRVCEEVCNRGGVQRKKKRAKNGTLRDASGDRTGFRRVILDGNKLGAIRKIRGEKRQGSARETERGVKSGKEYVVVNSVKCSREIKKNECSGFLFITSKKKIILNVKKSSFSRMELAIGRLKATDRRERLKM